MILGVETAKLVIVGAIIAGVMLLVWPVMFVVVLRDRRPKDSTPANMRPYLEDDALETSRLERLLKIAVVTTLFLGVAMAVIFVNEPNREATAYKRLSEKAVATGTVIFGPVEEVNSKTGEKHPIRGAFGCQNCHGAKGVGGAAPYTITTETGATKNVTWAAPSLNDVLARFGEEEVRTIIIYGRPGTPMAPWGAEAGGAMVPQQIEDVLAYIESIQLPPEELHKRNAKAGLRPDNVKPDTSKPVANADYDGQTIFDEFCARCHTTGFSYGAPEAPGNGAFGPSLRGGATLSQFTERQAHIDFVAAGSDWQKAYGVGGIGTGRMPGFAELLLPAQIAAVVDFERSLTGGYASSISGANTRTEEPTSTERSGADPFPEKPTVKE